MHLHDPKITFVQMGFTKRFGWATLLLALVAGQAMLGVAKVLTTLLAR
jgi:hypothetical protein